MLFDTSIRIEILRRQNAQKVNSNRISGAVKALSDVQERKREDNIVKDVKNLFRLKKEIDNNPLKDMSNLFRLKKENEAIKNKIIRDIKTLFEEDDYYKPITVGNFWNNNYIE